MNNKEFIGELANRLSMDTKDVTRMCNALIGEIAVQLEEENSLSIANFGTFEVKKKLERVVINPATKQRMLVPPKLVLGFKPIAAIKKVLKEGGQTNG
jgi:nucleoid DNA-binding protein